MISRLNRIELGHNNKEKLNLKLMRWAVLQKWFSSCVGAEGAIFIAIAGHQTSPTCLAWLNSGAFGISFWQVGFCKEWCINCQEERKWARVAKFGTWNISFVIWWRQLLHILTVWTCTIHIYLLLLHTYQGHW